MVEWHLKFIVEPGEAELRFRHLFLTLQADVAVERVEISIDASAPEAQSLLVFFKEGWDRPENRRLHHCDKVYGTLPVTRKSRYDRLLEDKFFDE
jgi:hypothetical protein